MVAKELGAALVKALERVLHRDPALDVDGNTELGNASSSACFLLVWSHALAKHRGGISVNTPRFFPVRTRIPRLHSEPRQASRHGLAPAFSNKAPTSACPLAVATASAVSP